MTWDDASHKADLPVVGLRPQDYAEWVPWQRAWQDALYGEAGFYRRAEGPAGHFRTASHAAPDVLAAALLRLATDHDRTAIVDVGAGRGELLTALAAARPRVRLHGVDVVARPDALPDRVGWTQGADRLDGATLDGALVVAWELLDTVPCPVLEVDEEGALRVVLVEPASGRERLGPPASAADLAWVERWWPAEGLEEGDRVEAGGPRDALWAGIVARAPSGTVLLAVDYAHTRHDRPGPGTLAGYRAGRLVPARPDGSCDVTAHVAIDAVAAAGEAAGAATLALTSQREALQALGVEAPRPADGTALAPAHLAPAHLDAAHLDAAHLDAAHLAAAHLAAAHLAAASRAAELLDPHGLGGFSWLLQRRT